MSEPEPFDGRSYWEQRLGNDYSVTGVGEVGLGRSYNEWLYRVRRRVFRREVRRAGGAREWRIADVGSGTGFYVREWHGMGATHVTGLDIADVAVAALRARFPDDTFLRSDISDPSLIFSETFDAVSAFDVLFHIVDDSAFNQAILNLARAVRPGGYLFLSDLFQHSARVEATHQIGRSLAEYKRRLEDAGFRVVRRRPTFWLMSDPTDSGSRLHRRFYFLVSSLASKSDLAARVIGAVLFPLEILLTSVTKEGPSTEILVAQKA